MRLLIPGITFLAVTLAVSGWLAFRAMQIQDHLQTAMQAIPSLEKAALAGQLDKASDIAQEVEFETAAARQVSSDPLWRIAGTLPIIGANFSAIGDASLAGDTVTSAVAKLFQKVRTYPTDSLTPRDGKIDLRPYKELVPEVTRASRTISAAAASLRQVESDGLLPQVREPLSEAVQRLGTFSRELDSASSSLEILPAMLGSENERKYLVLVQNNAEVRATGGIAGAMVLVTAKDGRLELSDHASSGDIGRFKPALEVDKDQEQIYTTRLGAYIQNVNLTPDFPTAASTARRMWESKNPGSDIEGVLSIDPVALSYILEATGPIKLDDLDSISGELGSLPMTLSSENVVPSLLSDVYQEIEEPALQDAYFAAVASEVFSGLTDGGIDAGQMVKALQKGAEEKRLLVWSAVDAEQKIIGSSSLGGAIAGSADETAIGVYFNDGTGAKMDYYVRREVQLEKRCQPDGYYRYAVKATITNNAPADAGKSLPDYVTGAGAFGVTPGTVQTNIYAYGPTEWFLNSAAQDGKAAPFGSYKHDERPVAAATMSLAPGESTTVEFEFSTPYETDEPTLAVTPTVQRTSDVLRPTTASKDCG